MMGRRTEKRDRSGFARECSQQAERWRRRVGELVAAARQLQLAGDDEDVARALTAVVAAEQQLLHWSGDTARQDALRKRQRRHSSRRMVERADDVFVDVEVLP